MKLDLSRCKKISSDDKTTTFKNPAGHKVVVVHAALTPSERKRVKEFSSKYVDEGEEPKKFAAGGEVEEEDGSRAPASMIFPENAQAKSDKKLGITAKERAALDAVKAAEGPLPSDNYGPVRPAPTIMDRLNSVLSTQEEGDALALKQWQKGIAADQAKMAPAHQVQGPAPASLGAPVMAEPAQSASSYAPNLMGDLNAMRSAAMDYGKQADLQARQEMDVAKEQQKYLQLQQQEYQKRFSELDNEFKGVIHDVQKQHINPKHYMENMSAGKKVATAIGLILGGMGAGLTGGDNMAQKFLQSQIDRDIEAQKANLGKSETLLSANLKRFGNMNDAMQMTQAMQLGIYSAKLKEAAAKSTSAKAKFDALNMATELDLKASELLQTQAAKQATMGILNNPSAPPLQKIQALPKELQNDAIKELNTYSQIQNSLKQVGPVLREAFKNTTLGENLKNPIQSAKKRDIAFSQLFPIVKSIVGEKMTKDDAEAMVKPFISGFTTNEKTNEENIRKLEAQLAGMASASTPILSQYGIVSKLEPTPEIKTMGGVKYQKVPGGWKKVQ